MLQAPTHIFLYNPPDQFHREICNPKILVVKAKEGKDLPLKQAQLLEQTRAMLEKLAEKATNRL